MKIRNCITGSTTGTIHTGTSKCEIPHGKVKGAILVPHGFEVSFASASALTTACHAANTAERIFPIKTFVEYAKNGGEIQTASVGYGPEKVTGFSAMTEQYTMDNYSDALARNIASVGNKEYDAYFVDEDNFIYGYEVEGKLLGLPLSYVSATTTPHPTSSEEAQLVINFAHKDAKKAMVMANYEQAGFDVLEAMVGLMEVDLVKTASNKYKVVETVGGYDCTAIFGAKVETCITGGTSVSYDSATNTITGTGTLGIAACNVLHTNGIDGYEWTGTTIDQTA